MSAMQTLIDGALGAFYALKELLLTIAAEAGPIVTTLVPTFFAARAIALFWPDLAWGRWLIVSGMWFVGLATVKGSLNAYAWNQEAMTPLGNLRKGYEGLAPFGLWTTIAATYYLIELLIVMVLETANVVSEPGFVLAVDWARLLYVAAPGTFVILSAIANVALALGLQQARREAALRSASNARRSGDRSDERSEASDPNVQSNVQAGASPDGDPNAGTFDLPKSNAGLNEANQARAYGKDGAMSALLSYLNDHPNASLSEAGRAIGRGKSTVAGYVDELSQAGALSRNGQGWKVLERSGADERGSLARQ